MATAVTELGVLAVRCFGGCFAWLGGLDVGFGFGHVFDWRLDTGAIANATVVIQSSGSASVLCSPTSHQTKAVNLLGDPVVKGNA